jgi:putative oxidoreductase
MELEFLLLDLQRAIVALFVFKGIVLLCAAFFAIVFCQSAFDKISDYAGNKAYFQSQFGKSILKNFSGVLLPVLTVLELGSGLACAIGIIWRLLTHDALLVSFGIFLSACTLLCLMCGQRIVKDYAGAASITSYFAVAILGLLAVAASL